MASLNKVTIIGNVGKEPEIKTIPSGVKIAKFSVATSERFKKGENWEDKTEWHNVVAFGKVAERVERIVQKGTSVYLEGKISTRMWETDSGEKRYTTEINCFQLQALSNRKETGGSGATPTPQQASIPPTPSGDIDDDLPF